MVWLAVVAIAVVSFTLAWYSIPDTAFLPPRPSTFFEWCASEKFGETSQEGKHERKSGTEYVGEIEGSYRTPVKSDDEAEFYLKQAARSLVGELKSKGCKVDSPYIGPELVMITYKMESVSGTLEGGMETTKIEHGGKRTTAWFIHWKLIEWPIIR